MYNNQYNNNNNNNNNQYHNKRSKVKHSNKYLTPTSANYYDMSDSTPIITNWCVTHYKNKVTGTSIARLLELTDHIGEGLCSQSIEIMNSSCKQIKNFVLKKCSNDNNNKSYIDNNFFNFYVEPYDNNMFKIRYEYYMSLVKKFALNSHKNYIKDSQNSSNTLLLNFAKSLIITTNHNSSSQNKYNNYNNTISTTPINPKFTDMINSMIFHENNYKNKYSKTFDEMNSKVKNEYEYFYNDDVPPLSDLQKYWGVQMEYKLINMIKNVFKFNYLSTSTKYYKDNNNIYCVSDGMLVDAFKGYKYTNVEFKCPYNGKVSKFIKIVDYLQIQLEMACYEVYNTLLFVWTPSGFVQWHVLFDEELWQHILNSCINLEERITTPNYSSKWNRSEFLSTLIRYSIENHSTLINYYYDTSIIPYIGNNKRIVTDKLITTSNSHKDSFVNIDHKSLQSLSILK